MPDRICPACEKGTLRPTAKTGRTMKHRNLFDVAVPAGFAIPTCTHCRAEVVNFKLAEKLAAVLETEWQAALGRRAADSIEKLKRARPIREWERLLGLSVGYLSKLRGGKSPGAPLTGLLALLANDPRRARELERAWKGPNAV